MRQSTLRRLRLTTCLVALPAAALGAGCIEDGAGSSEERFASQEEALGLPVGYTGYLNARDLNHDGRPDLVVINVVGSTLGVRLNKGDGTFHNVIRYNVGVTPTFLACDDFDDNGDLDVAVVNAVTNDISVFLGDGDGSLDPSGSYSVANLAGGALASTPFGIVTGDFDGDAAVDIATSNLATNNASTLLGNGDGSFQPAHAYPFLSSDSAGLVSFPIITADIDADGDLDLVAGGTASITILRGHGDGSFTADWHYHTGVAISCIEVADFNGDGAVDIATTGIGTSNYSILLGHGDGTFTLKESKWSGGIAGECFGIGDLNGDHELDLAITNTTSLLGVGNVAVLLGHGDGTFGSPVGNPVGLTPWSANIVDFNGDGVMDVGVANGVNTSVSILLGNGDGTLKPQVMYPM